MSNALIGPKKKPQDFKPKGTWFHLVVNDKTQSIIAFDQTGNKLWEAPALARGQLSDFDYEETRSDTPPGLYRCDKIYRDYDVLGVNPPYSKNAMSYGWYSIDLIDLEGQERRFGRAGIMIHGGGSACGWPGAWAPIQPLYPTLGCIRVHNKLLKDKIVPMCDKGEVFISVYQEAS